jgi:hypothetical protein
VNLKIKVKRRETTIGIITSHQAKYFLNQISIIAADSMGIRREIQINIGEIY